MSAQRMNDRLGWSPSPSGAILNDYVMVFNKHSNDGGKANIMYSPGNLVEGIIYSVNEEDLLILDKFEGVATETESKTASTAIPLSLACSCSGIPNFL